MSSQISSAQSARENAREHDGRFGEQEHARADGVDLGGTVQPSADALAEKYGFDVMTAPPAEFDQHDAEEFKKYTRALQEVGYALDSLHRDMGDRRIRGRSWYKKDQEVFDEARQRVNLTGPHSSIGRSLAEVEATQAASDAAKDRYDELEQIRSDRGGWNRAYLATSAKGHVHKSMFCGTTRPTTQFAWMTDSPARTSPRSSTPPDTGPAPAATVRFCVGNYDVGSWCCQRPG